jgi:hypothetical protein
MYIFILQQKSIIFSFPDVVTVVVFIDRAAVVAEKVFGRGRGRGGVAQGVIVGHEIAQVYRVRNCLA